MKVQTHTTPNPHDPVDLWLTRAKIGAFGIAGIAGNGAVITYGISTNGVYGAGAVLLRGLLFLYPTAVEAYETDGVAGVAAVAGRMPFWLI